MNVNSAIHADRETSHNNLNDEDDRNIIPLLQTNRNMVAAAVVNHAMNVGRDVSKPSSETSLNPTEYTISVHVDDLTTIRCDALYSAAEHNNAVPGNFVEHLPSLCCDDQTRVPCHLSTNDDNRMTIGKNHLLS